MYRTRAVAVFSKESIVSKQISLPAIFAAALLGFAAPLSAQDRSGVSNSDLDAALVSRASQRSENQRTVRDFLETERVRTATSAFGVRTEDLTSRIGSLDEATLARIADAARTDERALAGGDTIVISTTAIIIGLLILILLTD